MKRRRKTRIPSFEHEAARLRRVASDVRAIFDYPDHALAEMAKDQIYRIDVENMLRRCRVTYVEEVKGEETLRAEGSDSNGRKITAVVVAYEKQVVIKIITSWERRSKGT